MFNYVLQQEISPNRHMIYRKISNIRRTNSQNLNDSHLVLQSSLPNPLKPGVKSRMKIWLEQRRQAMLQLYLSDQQFNSWFPQVLMNQN